MPTPQLDKNTSAEKQKPVPKDTRKDKPQQAKNAPPCKSRQSATKPSSKTQNILGKICSRASAAFVATIIAFGIWFYISVYDMIEMRLEVLLVYQNIPKNLVITNGLIDKIQVRVKGPDALMRLSSQRSINLPIDLSHIKPGINKIPFVSPSEDKEGFQRAFELVDIQPPRLNIKVEPIVERSVPVRPIVKTSLLDIADLRVKPENVTLRGPQSIVSTISNISLPVSPNTTEEKTSFSETLPLDTPSLVTSSPATVSITYKVIGGRKTISRKYPVDVLIHNPQEYIITPREITLYVNVPKGLAKSEEYLSQLTVSVVPPDIEPGESVDVDVRYLSPDGMKLMNPLVSEVKVTRKHSPEEDSDQEDSPQRENHAPRNDKSNKK